MLPQWVKRLGKRNLVVLVTIASMLASVGISIVLHSLSQGGISLNSLLISIFIPLVLTPFFGGIFLKPILNWMS